MRLRAIKLAVPHGGLKPWESADMIYMTFSRTPLFSPRKLLRVTAEEVWSELYAVQKEICVVFCVVEVLIWNQQWGKEKNISSCVDPKAQIPFIFSIVGLINSHNVITSQSGRITFVWSGCWNQYKLRAAVSNFKHYHHCLWCNFLCEISASSGTLKYQVNQDINGYF